MKEAIKIFWKKDWTASEKLLLLADVLLAGVLIGWLTAPFKGGFFSNNRIRTINGTYPEDEDIFEEDEQ